MNYKSAGVACLILMISFSGMAQMANDSMRAQNARVTKPKAMQSAFGSIPSNQQSGSANNQAFSQNPSDQGYANQQSMQPDQGYQQNQNGASPWSGQQGQSQQPSPFAQDPNGYNQNNGGYQNYQQNGQSTGVNSIATPKSALQR
jgi:hypothetical protein